MQLKIQNNETKQVTITSTQPQERKSEKFNSTFYVWNVLYQNQEYEFLASEVFHSQLLDYKEGDLIDITKQYNSETSRAKYVANKVVDAGDNLSNIKTILTEKEDGNAISRHGFVTSVFNKMVEDGKVKADIYDEDTQKVISDCVTYVKTGKISLPKEDEVEFPF